MSMSFLVTVPNPAHLLCRLHLSRPTLQSCVTSCVTCLACYLCPQLKRLDQMAPLTV